jgi:hypothetical protein
VLPLGAHGRLLIHPFLLLQIQILLNQFYEHKTAADHAGDLLVVRLASINQTLDPWVYILSKKVNI